jgi:uncharacterized protein (DUF2336 family)
LAKPERFNVAMDAELALIRELDSKIGQISGERRALLLRRLTDLFLAGAEQYSDDEVALIDNIFVRLVETIEESARALLSTRLGPIAKAPPKILHLLACDDAIDVASSVLIQSEGLDDSTLIECAMMKSQEHLLAISQRKTLSERVTDVLVARGDRQVVLSTARNAGARYSKLGFGILVERAQGDDALASSVGARADLPRPLFEKLLETASETVRAKLVAERHHTASDISRVVSDVTARISTAANTQAPTKAAAHVLVDSLNRAGKLNGARLVEFVKSGQLEEAVAALALMARAPLDVVEEMLRDPHVEGLLVLTKAIGLSWETTQKIITASGQNDRLPSYDTEKCHAVFRRLNQTTAQKIVAFHRNRKRGNAAN